VRKKIEIYDTTLRDGNQGEGVNLSLADKLDITAVLDDMGVDFIEGGWPGSNPKDIEYFQAVKDVELRTARISAFGSTHRANIDPADDFFLTKLVEAGADVTCIFGKAWDLHVDEALRVTGDTNLDMIAGSVRFLAEATGKPVFFDAEHFFDGFKSDPGYALAALQVAAEAGAERVVLCDTNGGVLPHELAHAIREARREIPGIKLGIHVHNDGGLAVANTLRAIEEGAIQVQGTINGVGERCGNVDLTSVLGNLELKMGYQCLPEGKIEGLTALSRSVWEYVGMQGPLGQPFVGPAAFAHKGGVHVSAVQRNPVTYEHIRPEEVGNSRKVLISELSGGSNLRAKLANRYPELGDNDLVKAILEDVQDREHAGYSFENADGSFDLLVRQHLGRFSPAFLSESYTFVSTRDHTDSDADDPITAVVEVRIGDSLEMQAARGNGPVDALNNALSRALRPHFEVLAGLHLTDYNVRVVNSTEESAARVRVYIEHSFQGHAFATMGVDVDVIKASWNALVEGYQYALMESADFGTELNEIKS
tara:strand:- start:1518 stop:3128 length:1611 start_codon:yes stop_codon:yes gene_type:complete